MSDKKKSEMLPNIKVALDAMGGDNAPAITVKGACQATLESPVHVILVGDEARIDAELKKHKYEASQIEIVHTPEQITMHDNPKQMLLKKPDASVAVAARLVGQHEADALVSAGNTGAVILSSARHIKRIMGVRKTALAAIYPTQNAQKREDIFSIILDVGANLHNTHHDLVHFAYMGATYASKVKNIESPTVALLNVGREEYKGGETLSKTHQLLSSIPNINFIGNIEGNELMLGLADVLVTEGLTGNIAIKTAEGVASAAKKLGKMASKQNPLYAIGFMFLYGGYRRLKSIVDYEQYGGAPVFGFERMVIKCHGRSGYRSIKNAIKLAAKSVRDDMTGIISTSIAAYEKDYAMSDLEIKSDFY
jgi:phosphate acyltransferase